jgi:hypothetical protein
MTCPAATFPTLIEATLAFCELRGIGHEDDCLCFACRWRRLGNDSRTEESE